MDEKSVDDVLMPGFRFHPTDEELVGFYLKKKIQNKSLSIELIKPVDIYKHDPWDLPKLATTGEKEWYFYCPRDRKYKNSARPNRVTSSGFWKATGTDRPIYSSDGSKCIGLKKSLVFYRGRAAKGLKTDWMMHEFRMPSLTEPAPPLKKLYDKSIHPNDAWAICKVFKKTNSMAQRVIAQTWMPQHLPPEAHCSRLISENTTEIGPTIQLNSNEDLQALDFPSYKPFNPTVMFSPAAELSGSIKSTPNPMIMNHDISGEFGDKSSEYGANEENNQWALIGFPFSLPSDIPEENISNGWKPDFEWESPSCPSEMSTITYSTQNCYTPPL